MPGAHARCTYMLWMTHGLAWPTRLPIQLSVCATCLSSLSCLDLVQVSLRGDGGIRFSGYDNVDDNKAFPKFEVKTDPVSDALTIFDKDGMLSYAFGQDGSLSAKKVGAARAGMVPI